MNKLISQIFKNRTANYFKLKEYGFNADGNYKTQILNGQFEFCIEIKNQEIQTRVIELETNEPYTLFLADGATGSFIGEVRAEYERVLNDIADKCFDVCIFKNEQSKLIIEYVKKTYGGELEFLWEKFSDNAVWRRKDNNKWYGVFLTVAENKLGLVSDKKNEILDLRIDPDEMETTVDNKTFFHGYHMNKKHWITVLLDGSADTAVIYRMIDRSYELAKK